MTRPGIEGGAVFGYNSGMNEIPDGCCSLMDRREFIACASLALAAGCVNRTNAGDSGPAAQPAGDDALHEARWYTKMKDNRVRCDLCPRQCQVPDGRRGHCRVRENRGGKYYALSYGLPVTANLDPIEKKPFMHVYPGTKAFSIATAGCNINCKFCQNWEISQKNPEDFKVPFTSPETIAKAAAAAQAKTIAYTYSEPTVFSEYVIDCAKAGKALGIESIMITNGFIAAKAQEEVLPVLKAIKVDLKSFSKDFYRDVCNGALEPVLESLKRISKSGVWLEIVVLLIPTLNDDADDLKRMTAWIVKELGPDVPVIFTAYHPAYKITNIPPTPGETLEKARAIAHEQGCHYSYGGNIPGMKAANTYCPSCRNLVVERYGYKILKSTNGKCDKCGAVIPGLWS